MTLESIKHKYGKYQKQADSSIKLIEHKNHIGLIPETTVGFTYEVKSDKSQQLKVRNEYIYSNGKIKTSESIIDTNDLFASILTFHSVENDILGEMVFRVSFPNNPEVEKIEQAFYLFDKFRGLLFQNNPFSSATEKDILEFENKYKTSLCEDYKYFLKTHNGLYIDWWAFSNELDKTKGAYQSDKYGFIQTHYPFYEDLGKLKENWDWIYDAQALFGLGNKNPYLDMNDFYMQSLFYHNDLVKYAYPIGQDGGGNCIMQIAQGKHRGKLAMLDHEVSGAMVDWIEGKTVDVYEISPENATVDGFLDDCFEYGGLTLHDITLDQYLTELLKKHKDLYKTIQDKYGK
jgi:hypothetical protein